MFLVNKPAFIESANAKHSLSKLNSALSLADFLVKEHTLPTDSVN